MPDATGGAAAVTTAALADAAPCGLLSIDARGVITAANALVLRWAGRPEAEVTGRLRLADLLRGGSRLY